MSNEPTQPTIAQRATAWLKALTLLPHFWITLAFVLVVIYVVGTGKCSSCLSSCRDAKFDEETANRNAEEQALKERDARVDGKLDAILEQAQKATNEAKAMREDLNAKDKADVEQQQRTGSARKNYRETVRRPATPGAPVPDDRIRKAAEP